MKEGAGIFFSISPIEPPMPSITIDNIDYDLDSLSEEAKAQIVSLQFVDAELQRLQAKAAALQTARAAYARALSELLAQGQTQQRQAQ